MKMNSKKSVYISLFVIILSVAIGLISSSLKKLRSTEYGVEYDIYTKKLNEAIKMGGLHAGPPGFEFIKFPSTFITTDFEGTCVSRDGLRVNLMVTYQYQMPEEWILSAIMKYRNFKRWSNVVEAAGRSALQHSCSEFAITSFQSKRGIIQGTMENKLRVKLEGSNVTITDDGVYARAISLQLKNVELPQEYQDAVTEKQSAEEDISLAKNQYTQEVTKAQTSLLAAKEEVRKIKNNALNEVNVTLTEANLRAEEILFTFETEANVIVEAKQNFDLTTDGVLAYLSNQLYEKATNLKVSAAEPASLSRKDKLEI